MDRTDQEAVPVLQESGDGDLWWNSKSDWAEMLLSCGISEVKGYLGEEMARAAGLRRPQIRWTVTARSQEGPGCLQ